MCEPVAFLKYIVVIISICCLIFSVFVVSSLPWREIQFQSNRFVSKILESYFCLGKRASFDSKFGLLQLGVASKGIYFFRIFCGQFVICSLSFVICLLVICYSSFAISNLSYVCSYFHCFFAICYLLFVISYFFCI